MEDKDKKPKVKKSPMAKTKEATANKRATKASKKPAVKKAAKVTATITETKKVIKPKVDVVNITMKTSFGDIALELYPDKAPITVANFIKYIDSNHFTSVIFHRVIPNFMIQGGGFSEDFTQKGVFEPIAIESNNGLKNLRGTIAMARTSEPNSATSQFFINLIDNAFLDFREPSPQGYGYTVFGKVTSGLDVVDKIGAVRTGNRGYHSDVPVENIVIKNIKTV